MSSELKKSAYLWGRDIADFLAIPLGLGVVAVAVGGRTPEQIATAAAVAAVSYVGACRFRGLMVRLAWEKEGYDLRPISRQPETK